MGNKGIKIEDTLKEIVTLEDSNAIKESVQKLVSSSLYPQ